MLSDIPTWVFAFLGLIVWTVASVLCFINLIGDKHRRVGPVQDGLEHVFFIPVMVIAFFIGCIFKNPKPLKIDK